ncbi:MAG: WecB/TagA/CpsF family glycosyltransferase [Reichenbachiella sp.]|uniref:WecB/TagA/CpsF family glycosyltransferase n=1 Tax=Reichenbachiella sp. TaxID=2184521 RepID=UPI0032650C92
MSNLKILDIRMYDKDIPSAVDEVIDSINNKEAKNRLISATGAHGIVHARSNSDFKSILNQYYFNLPDGMPAVWIGKLKGHHQMKRCYGPDFFAYLMKASKNENINHYFCGGMEGVADLLKIASREKFENNRVVGTFCPPFLPLDKYDFKAIADDINIARADIVWIGLGAPKQEQFGYRLAEHTNVSYIITVGAAFDFHTDRLVQSPAWIQKIGMEWFFRLIIEPKRLWKRYLDVVPKFIFFNLISFIRGDK